MTESVEPRVFMSPAYLKVIEKNTYGLFRNIETESFDSERGYPVRERVGEIGPIKVLREAERGEDDKIVMRTVHPVTARELSLVEV